MGARRARSPHAARPADGRRRLRGNGPQDGSGPRTGHPGLRQRVEDTAHPDRRGGDHSHLVPLGRIGVRAQRDAVPAARPARTAERCRGRAAAAHHRGARPDHRGPRCPSRRTARADRGGGGRAEVPSPQGACRAAAGRHGGKRDAPRRPAARTPPSAAAARAAGHRRPPPPRDQRRAGWAAALQRGASASRELPSAERLRCSTGRSCGAAGRGGIVDCRHRPGD